MLQNIVEVGNNSPKFSANKELSVQEEKTEKEER